jgi:PDZ domain
MKNFFGLWIALGLLACQALGQEQRSQEPFPWERSIVTLEVTRKQYDYQQPWSKRLKHSQKTGLVVGERQILTTADEMFDRTLVRVQREGRGKWWVGELTWIDYHADLALVTVPEEAFWRGLQPVTLAEPTRGEGELQILRWRQARLENRRAEFNQFTAAEGHLSYAPRLEMELSSEIQGAGAGEPLISKSRVEGILAAQEGSTCTAIPSAFAQWILAARRAGTYHGLGYFNFVWQPAENPSSLAYLKLEGEPQGVLVIDVPYTPGVQPLMKPRDVILKVDGFDVDIQGDYQDPDYGPLLIENLATRRKWAGDEVKLQVLRDGVVRDLTYHLPKADYKSQLVPDEVFDQDPEYLIVGGLVFQPLTGAFLHSWGSDWKRRSPFRLFYYTDQHPTPDRRALVVLSQVLPDIYNLGYQDLKYLVVDEVNGRKISTLPELREALQHPVNGFHTIDFVQSDSLRRLVLAADDQEPATKRVLARYGITKEYFFAQPDRPKDTGVAARE